MIKYRTIYLNVVRYLLQAIQFRRNGCDYCRVSSDDLIVLITLDRGAALDYGGHDTPERVECLKAEIQKLDRLEKEVDQHKIWVQQSIKNVTDDPNNSRSVALFHVYLGSVSNWATSMVLYNLCEGKC